MSPSRITVFLLLAVSLVFALLFARQMIISRDLPRADYTLKKLHVLTYSTFVGGNGPGEEILRRFKTEHPCEVEVQTVGDAGLLLERLRLTPFDAVVGLDQLMLDKAARQTAWRAVSLPGAVDLPATHNLVPYDWSPLTFVYRTEQGFTPPNKIDDLVDPRFAKQIALEDPHTSSPGLQFLNWAREVKGAELRPFLEKLKPSVQMIAPSWAFAYGLFEKKQVKLVFSYLTSLAYHWGVDHDRSFQVVQFAEGHPVQIEYAGVPDNCKECELAARLVSTLTAPWAQTLIMHKNFMLPVVKDVEKDSVFAELPQLKTLPSAEAKEDFHDWDEVFRH